MSAELSDVERLAIVETKVDNIVEKVDNVDAKVERIDNKLDAWTKYFVPRPEINEMFKSRDERMDGFQRQLDEIREEKMAAKHSWPVWISTAIAFAALLVSLWFHRHG